MRKLARLAGPALVAASALTITLGVGVASAAPEPTGPCTWKQLKVSLGPITDNGERAKSAELTFTAKYPGTDCTLQGEISDLQLSREGQNIPTRTGPAGGSGEPVRVQFEKSDAKVQLQWKEPAVSIEPPDRLTFSLPDVPGPKGVSWNSPVEDGFLGVSTIYPGKQG